MSKLPRIARISAIILVVSFVGLLGLRWLAREILKPINESGQHVVRVDWLPKEATDVTYIRQGDLFWLCVYECAMPREAFTRFAKENGWLLKEERNVSAGTFRSFLKLPPIRPQNPQDDSYPIALTYQERKQNGGGVTVIYDLATQRLFVSASSN